MKRIAFMSAMVAAFVLVVGCRRAESAENSLQWT